VSTTHNRRKETLRGVAPLRLRSCQDADMRTIVLVGELDLATAHTLQRELDDAEAADARLIVLDLRELEFIDSSGLSVIINAHRRGGAQLLILKGPERVQRAFGLCGLLELLTFVDEHPPHSPAQSTIRAVAEDGGRSTVTRRAATLRRAGQGALAAGVRELRSHRRLRSVQ
jgi:anti-sigma B factor antagonist